jgi:hypothetical protein
MLLGIGSAARKQSRRSASEAAASGSTKYELRRSITMATPNTATPQASAPQAAPPTRTANFFTLHSNVIQGGQFFLHVVYSTSGFDGKPHLQYHDPSQTLDFSGDQITTTPSPIGTLVTVTIRRTVDSGSTTFSLLVPQVNLGHSTSASIRTFGVTTVHRFSIVPFLAQGQTELYTVTELQGTAESVAF